MPWKETHVMDLKIKMINDWLSNNYNPTQLAKGYGVSRKTIYKWINRYKHNPQSGLADRSRAPHSNPNAVPDEVKRAIIATKLKYPHLGPKKVMNHLRRHFPNQYWPANSTADKILLQTGLVKTRRRKPRVAPSVLPFLSCDTANSVWSADYKGDFLLGDRTRCYPLTVSDNFSRYMLACQGLKSTNHSQAQAVFQELFGSYGLPKAIRTDNGAPFASTAFGGLSRLSAWWVRLGIRPERIEKAKPNQNGRHERMHRSLKEGAINPARYSLKTQQRAFDQYRQEYNDIRSHEALNGKVPADVYQSSVYEMPSKLPIVQYDTDFTVRQVKRNGVFKWQGKEMYISQVLAEQPVGLKQISENRWSIYYSFYQLGYWNQRKQRLEPITIFKNVKVQKNININQ